MVSKGAQKRSAAQAPSGGIVGNEALPAFLRRERFLDMTAGIAAWPSAEDLPPFRALEQAVLDTALARN